MTKPITEASELSGDLLEGYHLEAALVPPAYPYHLARWESDDRSISVAKTMGSMWCRVHAGDPDSFIAIATFAADDVAVRCDTIDVDAAHRCKGIATALYKVAACTFEHRSCLPTPC